MLHHRPSFVFGWQTWWEAGDYAALLMFGAVVVWREIVKGSNYLEIEVVVVVAVVVARRSSEKEGRAMGGAGEEGGRIGGGGKGREWKGVAVTCAGYPVAAGGGGGRGGGEEEEEKRRRRRGGRRRRRVEEGGGRREEEPKGVECPRTAAEHWQGNAGMQGRQFKETDYGICIISVIN